MQHLAGDELAGYLQQLAAQGELHAEALMAAVDALGSRCGIGFPESTGRHRRTSGWSWKLRHFQGPGRPLEPEDVPSSDDLARLETALASKGDERLRRIGLQALIAQCDDHRGWDEGRLARLRGFRADPSPLVAGAAQFTLPADELE